jgi:hypothetical protein
VPWFSPDLKRRLWVPVTRTLAHRRCEDELLHAGKSLEWLTISSGWWSGKTCPSMAQIIVENILPSSQVHAPARRHPSRLRLQELGCARSFDVPRQAGSMHIVHTIRTSVSCRLLFNLLSNRLTKSHSQEGVIRNAAASIVGTPATHLNCGHPGCSLTAGRSAA